jgi:hypothetical protein
MLALSQQARSCAAMTDRNLTTHPVTAVMRAIVRLDHEADHCSPFRPMFTP